MKAVMRRWAWNIFCALSLLIFATSVTLWVRSYLKSDSIEGVRAWPDTTQFQDGFMELRYELASRSGASLFSRSLRLVSQRDLAPIGWHRFSGPTTPITFYNGRNRYLKSYQFWGFHFRRVADTYQPTGPKSSLTIVLPYWLFLIFAVPPVVWWRKWRKGSRRGFPVERAAASFAKASAEQKNDPTTPSPTRQS